MAPTCNHLIELLLPQERLNFLSRCEQVPLVMSEVLGRPGQPTCHAYFPIDGFISQVAQVDGRLALEVGMVGREGLLGAAADDFCAVLKDSQALLAGVNRDLCVLMAQRTGLAACHRFHTIVPRLARWLLMTQDRSDASSFHVTHQYLAFLLGVRRVGITTAAGRLQREGLITYHRGQAAVACSCYAADRKVYAALMS